MAGKAADLERELAELHSKYQASGGDKGGGQIIKKQKQTIDKCVARPLASTLPLSITSSTLPPLALPRCSIYPAKTRVRMAGGPTFHAHTNMDIGWRAEVYLAAEACSHPLH
jgi:hypothetical protein